MNRRFSSPPTPRLSLRWLLNRAQWRSMLLALGLAGFSLTLLGIIALRSYTEHQLNLLARSLSYTLEAAVVFKDTAAVRESLELVASGEKLAQARVTDQQGQLLAQWQHPDNGAWVDVENRLADLLLSQPLVKPIHHQGKTVGELSISSRGNNLVHFVLSGAIALLGSLILGGGMAYYSAWRIQKRIMHPLNSMADVANAIAQERTFTRRVPASQIAELDDIGENFNRLLDEIEAWQNQLQRENASLAHRASHDSLTGLPNRAHFEPALARATREAKKHTDQFALMFIDCNHFKQINDVFGHAAGDLVLVKIADRLREQLRADDLVARLGGDEFAVLLKPIQQQSDVTHIAEKILNSMKTPIALQDGGQLEASLSIGIALYPYHASDLNTLLHQADAAMYNAKRNHSGYQLAQPQNT